jgi:hypothetical protein
MEDVAAQERDDAVIAKVRDQTGAEERRLAHTGLAVEQPGPETLRRYEPGQVVSLAVAAEEDVPLRFGERVEPAQGCDRPGIGRGRHEPTIPR